MAEAESSAAASKHASTSTSLNQLDPNYILHLAHAHSKTKDRTLTTAKKHLQDIEAKARPVRVALLGASMIERMTTTGRCESFDPWPSETMLPETSLRALNEERENLDEMPISRKEGVANFGCGGDKIENVLYRLVGDDSQNLKGLVHELSPAKGGNAIQRKPKLWVVQAGTNNLHSKKGLTDASLFSLEILLRVLHQESPEGSKFLLTGLFYRTDIRTELVDKANVSLRHIVVKLEQEVSGGQQSTEQSHGASHRASETTTPAEMLPSDHHERGPPPPWDRADGTFRFLPAPGIDDFDAFFEDHVHLNEKGYRKWMDTLLPKVDEMLRPAPPPDDPKPKNARVSENNDVHTFNNFDPVTPAVPSPH
ncbi:cetylhydrolase [Diaporthe amygdali]|uniref:cetylhydrolase n=1 Tax=Phomopsis amygdali TaxID=1214568 RepID=UPI0022FEC1F2|nr:cetylhydrolase [Diaporthe amygdali]KAJ0109733.1 cetylhydrolase [Diaporthe amygdali]